MGISEFIKEKRIARKLSVNKVSIPSGVSMGYLNNIERGDNSKPSCDILKRISIAIDVPYYDLLEAAGYISRQDARLWVGSEHDIQDHHLIELIGIYQSIPVDKRGYFISAIESMLRAIL